MEYFFNDETNQLILYNNRIAEDLEYCAWYSEQLIIRNSGITWETLNASYTRIQDKIQKIVDDNGYIFKDEYLLFGTGELEYQQFKRLHDLEYIEDEHFNKIMEVTCKLNTVSQRLKFVKINPKAYFMSKKQTL